MPAVGIRDEEIKADILNRLFRRGCWGGRYLPVKSLVNWLGKQIKKNGRRVRKAIDELHKDGLLLKHKGGETISLNTKRKREITEHLARFL